MGKYAKLDDSGIVVQIQPNNDNGLILVDDYVENGMVEVDGVYSLPFDINSIKQKRKKYINAMRRIAIDGGIEYDGNSYDSTQASRDNLAGVYTGINNGYSLPVDFSWRTADDITVPFAVEDVNAMSHIMLDHVNYQFGKSWTLKAAIDAATTEEEVNAIDW